MLTNALIRLLGRKASAAGTSDGAPSPEGSEPESGLPADRNGTDFFRSLFNGTPRVREPTPLQRRGRAVIERMRGKTNEPKTDSSGPRIGVALGGGSARGLTHIPYIEAMDELGLKPTVIAGTSIGALIGAGWANGMEGREIREHAYAVLGTTRTIAARLWGRHMRGLGSILQNGLSMQLDANAVVDAFLPEGFPPNFEDLGIPLYVVATDFQSWHQTVFNSGLVRPAIAGSIAIPSLFKPVNYANHLLVDGGVVNPLPLDQADIGTDFLIGIDVNGDPSIGLTKVNHGALDLWFGSAQIMMHSLTAHMMAAYPPDVYVRPHVTSFGAMEFWRVREIIGHADKEKERFKRMVTAKIEDYIQGKLPASGSQ